MAPNFSIGTNGPSRNFAIAGGATVDMNGVNAPNMQALSDVGSFGGVLTNTSATTATMTFTHGSDVGTTRTFSGIVTGNINLVWNTVAASTTATQPLLGQSTYTGFTTISLRHRNFRCQQCSAGDDGIDHQRRRRESICTRSGRL